jgi:predicted acetyltransferase
VSIEIRTIEADELDAYVNAVWRGFHHNEFPSAFIEHRRRSFDPGRYWVATERDQIVATLRTDPFDTTLPGGSTVPTAGLTNVTVAATHRRQGIMARMLEAELAAARERNEPLTSLIAAEWPIYGRFGYGPASQHVEYELAADARWTNPGEGRIEMVDTATLRSLAPEIYDVHRLGDHGDISRNAFSWDMSTNVIGHEPWKGFQVICRDGDDQPVGYATYTIDEHGHGRSATYTVTVTELMATTLAAEARLWRYLCEIDWITMVKSESRRVDEPLAHWIADGRDLKRTSQSDLIWARPLDVVACLAARTYTVPGHVVIEVDDPLGYCGGRYEVISGDDGKSACNPTTDAPTITLSMFALGAALYGGTSLRTLAAGGHVDEQRNGALATADLMFRTPVAPWTTTWF